MTQGTWQAIGVYFAAAALIVPVAMLPDNHRQYGILWLVFTLPATLQLGLATAALASRQAHLTTAQARALGARLNLVMLLATFAAPATLFVPLAGVFLRSDDGLAATVPAPVLLGVLFAVNLAVAGLVATLSTDGLAFKLATLSAPLGLAAWVGLASGVVRGIAVDAAPGGRDLGLGGLILLVTLPVAAALTGWVGAWLFARSLDRVRNAESTGPTHRPDGRAVD